MALIVTLIIIGVAFIVFALNLTKISIPGNSEEFEAEGVKETARIYRNQYGIPHITAENESDAFFMLGYAHAQDRLWQLDFLRRTANGRLSEIIGKETINADKFFRALGIKRTSYQIWKYLPKSSKNILSSYTEGINYFIKSHKQRLPFEFNALGYFPEKWEPTDCLAIGRLMAFQLSVGFWNDIALGEIAEKVGVRKALELIPSYPANAPHVLDDTNKVVPKKDSANAAQNLAYDNRAIGQLFSGFYSAMNEIRNVLGIKGSSFGSNSWAVRTTNNNKRGAILANDPHLFFQLPPIWYQVHLTCPSFNVVGNSIPGIPGILSGRNDNIAWGITNVMLDDCDFFIEKIDSTNSNFYITPSGTKAKFVYRADTIKVKNSTDIYYYIRYTNRSSVISDFHLFNHPEDVINLDKGTNYKNDYLNKYCITYSWLGNRVSDDVNALYRIMKSRNWQQFESAAHTWGVPAQNFTYADKAGNIGIAPSGMIPVRGPNCNPNVPNPGWMEGYAWVDVQPASVFPAVYNPPKNHVASANNKTSHSLGFYVSDYWEPSSRIERIEELLNMSGEYSARDAQLMQMDVMSPYARKMMGYVLPVLDARKQYMTDIEKSALQEIKKWDFILTPTEYSPSIYNAFLERYIYNTFADELGDRLYREYVLVSNVPTRRILEMTADSNNSWFNDIHTSRIETKENIIFKSFRDAVDLLAKVFNQRDVTKWRYGKIHTLTLKHVFSKNAFLKPEVTIGPFEMGGNLTTINNGEWTIFQPFDVVLGASMRFIADMQDTIVYTVVPGGSSGEPMSVNYGNQVQLWLNGGYIRISAGSKPTNDFKLAVVINPKH